jgi:hypothetical protein
LRQLASAAKLDPEFVEKFLDFVIPGSHSTS